MRMLEKHHIDAIKLLCEKRGGKADLARKTGISRGHIGRLENSLPGDVITEPTYKALFSVIKPYIIIPEEKTLIASIPNTCSCEKTTALEHDILELIQKMGIPDQVAMYNKAKELIDTASSRKAEAASKKTDASAA